MAKNVDDSAGNRPWTGNEFDDFLSDLAPALENSVARLGVAGSLGNRLRRLDSTRTILSWPDATDRIIEEMR